MRWYLRAFRKMWVPEGRARRAEFWWFIFFNLIANAGFIGLAFPAVELDSEMVNIAFGLL